ncbi:MAG TPA: TolC family protein [Fimbriimonas sp.]|nr:TolC family protein [Fimbriimonas sp.]
MTVFTTISATIAMIFAPQGPLTVEQAIGIAITNSYTIKNAEETVKSNEQKVREAAGTLGPKVTTNYNYVRFDKSQSGNIGGTQITFVPLDTNTWSTKLEMPLDVVGFWKTNVKGAKAGVEASRNSRTAVINDLKLTVRRAFIAVLRAKNLVEVAEQGNKNIATRVEQATKQYKQGAIAKIDVTRLEAQLANSNADVIAAKNGLQIAKQMLNLTLARPIETEFDVVSLPSAVDVNSGPDALITRGRSERPETKSLANTILALNSVRQVANAGMTPSLNLTVQNQQTLDPVGLNPQRESNTAALNLSVPLFDNGVSRAKMKQTDATIAQTQNNLEQLMLMISQEVRSAVTQMSSAKARVASAQKQVELAEEVVRIARIRRDAGEGTTLEIIDAETQWVTAKTNLVNSTYDLYQAYAELQRAVGNDHVESK